MGLDRQKKTMVIVLVVGAFLVVLNQTLLTPALPTIMSHLDVSATTAQWLTSGYSLMEAIVIPLNAYFLGHFPTRRIFICGMGVFAAGSVVCACAPSFPFLLLGRIMQASATGVVMPMVFTLILLIFARESRGSAMGLIGLIVSCAPAVGPSLSGVLVDTVGWRALFVLVATLAVVVLAVGAIALHNFEGFERTTFDAPSVVLVALGMGTLLYGISTSTSAPDGQRWIPAALIAFGVCVLALFARRQTQLENPILQVKVLKCREFATICGITLLLEGVLIGGSVLFPLYAQDALGASATVSGLTMLPGALVGAICSLLSGRIFDRFGVRGVSVGGGIVLVAGAAGYVMLGDATTLVVAGAAYTVVCIGVQALVTPLNAWGLNALPNASLAHGNAIVSTIEQVGASLGTAFVVSLTALAPLFTPAGASAAEQSFVGCHLAFFGMLGLTVGVLALIVVFVRDRKGKTQSADGD